jgi:hypothetical protein
MPQVTRLDKLEKFSDNFYLRFSDTISFKIYRHAVSGQNLPKFFDLKALSSNKRPIFTLTFDLS